MVLADHLPVLILLSEAHLRQRVTKDNFQVLDPLGLVDVGRVNNEKVDLLGRLNKQSPKVPLATVRMTQIDL